MMVTLKNNIILLRETKWRHGATARIRKEIFLGQPTYTYIRKNIFGSGDPRTVYSRRTMVNDYYRLFPRKEKNYFRYAGVIDKIDHTVSAVATSPS